MQGGSQVELNRFPPGKEAWACLSALWAVYRRVLEIGTQLSFDNVRSAAFCSEYPSRCKIPYLATSPFLSGFSA
jgi:hypothetical protein